jgi:hypothetical protein
MARVESLPLFYSLNRFLQYDGHIGAGSEEICRAEFLLDVLDDDLGMAAQAEVEGKLDTCGSVSLSLTPPICSRCKAAGSMASKRLS